MTKTDNMFDEHDLAYMKRALYLASLADHKVKSNPKVGAVIVHNDRIIGEGFHQLFGGPHAEVNALNSVSRSDRALLSHSKMYITLEPCNHFGKTPPCVSEVLQSEISEVIIANKDPNPTMNGKSIEILQDAGCKVRVGILSQEENLLNREFKHNIQSNLPYIILKWAQTRDGFISSKGRQLWISNQLSKLLVHRWRSQIDAILIGTNTALIDNPRLTTRLASGPSPVRVILDRKGRLPQDLTIFNDECETMIITELSNLNHSQKKQIKVIVVEEWSMSYIFEKLKSLGFHKLMVEGGAKLINNLISSDLWNEARVIKSPKTIEHGIKAPMVSGKLLKQYNLDMDKIFIINNLNSRK